jgi:membrane-anchored protein YejM (alkaline phosphatase superfamily)
MRERAEDRKRRGPDQFSVHFVSFFLSFLLLRFTAGARVLRDVPMGRDKLPMSGCTAARSARQCMDD